MLRYTLLIEEDRQRVVKPGNGYSDPTYETEVVTLCKVEGETQSRSTALDAIVAAAKDLQPVKALPSTTGYTTGFIANQPVPFRNGVPA